MPTEQRFALGNGIGRSLPGFLIWHVQIAGTHKNFKKMECHIWNFVVQLFSHFCQKMYIYTNLQLYEMRNMLLFVERMVNGCVASNVHLRLFTCASHALSLYILTVSVLIIINDPILSRVFMLVLSHFEQYCFFTIVYHFWLQLYLHVLLCTT